MRKALLLVLVHVVCASGVAVLAQDDHAGNVNEDILQQLIAANHSLDELVKLMGNLAEQQESNVLLKRLEIEESAAVALQPELNRIREKRDEAEQQLESMRRAVDRETNENLRLLYVGCTRAKHKLVLAHREGKYAWLAQLSSVDSLLNCSVGEGEHELDGIDTSFVLRHLNTDMVDDCRIVARQQERWLSLTGNPNPPDCSPRFHSPSQASAEPADATFHTEELPGPSHFPSGADEDQYAAIGDAVHSYLAALPSMRSLRDAEKEHVAERCLSAFSVTGILSPSVLVSSGERFCQWVEKHYPGAQWHVETAASGPRAAGGNWSGTVDLLLQLPAGGVVVIDHKSAPIRREHCEAKAGQFTGQLAAYREVLTSAGETVEATWIHFPLAGVVAKQV